MIPYLIVFLFVAVFYFQKNENKVSIGFYAVLALLIAFSGFRDMIGGFDVYIYGEVYESSPDFIKLYMAFEVGFKTYFLLLKNISNDRYFMFFFSAALMLSLQFFTIKKYSPVIYFSVFILFCKFFLMSFVYLRQGIAMGIIWFSLPLILDRKYLKFFLLAGFAFLFHKSSLIFLPIYFIANIKFKNLNMFVISVVALIVSVSPLSTFILGILAENADAKVGVYVEKSGGINVFYLIESAVLIYLMLKYRSDFYKTKFGTLILNGLFGYIIVNIMALTNASFLRFGWYYFIFLIIALPYIYTFIEYPKFKANFKLLIFIYYSFVFFRLLIAFDDGDFMPYKSIFQDFRRNGQWEIMEYR